MMITRGTVGTASEPKFRETKLGEKRVRAYARRAGRNTNDAVRKKRVQTYEREAGRNENARETTQGNLDSDLYRKAKWEMEKCFIN